jgi:hypothetical protein
MYEIEILMLTNAIVSLLLIMSELIGYSSCPDNSVSEWLISLIQGNKCIGWSNTEEQP